MLNLTQVAAQTLPNQLPEVCAGGKARYATSGLPGSIFDWNVIGGKIIVNYSDSIDVLWDSIPSIQKISVIEKVKGGCLGDTMFAKVNISGPKIEFNSDTTTCQGIAASLHTNNSFESFLWSTGDTLPEINPLTEGWYKLNVKNLYGCVASDSVHLTVFPKPIVRLGIDAAVCDNDVLMLENKDGLAFKWFVSENGPFELISAESGSSYKVTRGRKEIALEVWNGYGCVNSDTIKILACLTDYKIPNTFTPNGDGDNDAWRINYLKDFPNASIEVFDRWGRKVFESKNGFPSEGWDGTSRGKELPMDSYYYILKQGDGSDPIPGNVTIVR